ncbi:hypothetical protein IFM89_014424 [Coptis chinensis]|uniref:Uncharacterized protein n=1 Tax=Coptis chinensis TaxID=261450 RepID=A0A835HYE7_9MAGN|nr:hypothetical protein IFM89_014424 [Coptis chinensis]
MECCLLPRSYYKATYSFSLQDQKISLELARVMESSLLWFLLIHLLQMSLCSDAQIYTSQPPSSSISSAQSPMAQPAPWSSNATSPVTQPPLSASAPTQNIQPVLPEEEVDALNEIVSKLALRRQRSYTNQSCGNPDQDEVRCNCDFAGGTVCHVTSLLLWRQDLSGIISPTVGNLTYLESLDLSENQLNGVVPRSLGNLKSLLHIHLQYNFLEDEMPSTLGTLYNLSLLDLSSNKLTGSIPKELGDLSLLNLLRVRGTLLSGAIPGFIAGWSDLTKLHLMGSNFEGPLPSGILALSGLEELWVSDLVVTTDFSFPSMSRLTAMTSLLVFNILVYTCYVCD